MADLSDPRATSFVVFSKVFASFSVYGNSFCRKVAFGLCFSNETRGTGFRQICYGAPGAIFIVFPKGFASFSVYGHRFCGKVAFGLCFYNETRGTGV